MFEPIQNQKAYVQVASQLRRYILEGKLKPGDKLPPERVLAEQFGTSRPPIREALSALEMLGLVETRTGYGTVVKLIPQESMPISSVAGDSSPYDVLEARLSVEPAIARIACQRASEQDLQTIESILGQLKAAQAAQDYDAYNRVDADFHLALAKATHNEMLDKVGLVINVGMREKLWQTLKRSSLKIPSHIERYTNEHEAIFQSLMARNADLIERLVYDHIKSVDIDIFS